MVRAVDELLADALISDGTWAVLAAELDVQQLMDLVFTVGAYDLLAMAFRSFGVELDDDLLENALLFWEIGAIVRWMPPRSGAGT